MQTKLKGFWEKIKGFFAKLNKKTRILLGACSAVVLIMIIIAVVLLNQQEYAVLYTGLTASDTNTVVKYLSESGMTDFQIQNDTILVPKGREMQLQAQLAMAGYPNSGSLYESYKNGMGGINLNSEQDRMWLISKVENLCMVLRQLEEVKDVQVDITPGTERIYVLDPEATPAKAYVLVTPMTSSGLSKQTVSAIRNTVAHSIEGLELENISISDTYGNTYSDTDALGQMSEANAMKLQYEEEINNKVRRAVLDNLTSIYGPNNVNVQVNTVVDVDRKIVDTTTYHQPDGSVQGGGLIGTDKWLWEIIRNGDEPTGGTVGTPTNSDIPLYNELNPELNGNEDYANGSGERGHLVDTTNEQKEVLAATITDIGVIVTVNQNSRNSGAMTADSLRDHVATISNIGSEDPASRVSVAIVPFYTDEPAVIGDLPGLLSGVPDWVVFAAMGGLALFIILLIVVLMLSSRSRKRQLARQQAAEAEMMAAEAAAEAIAAAQAAVPAAGGADIMEVNTEKSMELRKTVRQFAQNNPEIAAQMVRAWLKGEDDNG